MLKYALLGAAMAMTSPVLAQTAPATATTPAAPAQTAPTTADPAAIPQDATAAPARADQTASATQTADATATPAAPADQVAQVVDREFGTYDKDGDGKLNEAEFGTWMVALKSQSDPATDANSPATKSWNKAAFAQADTDKSRTLTKTEITGFLAPSAKS